MKISVRVIILLCAVVQYVNGQVPEAKAAFPSSLENVNVDEMLQNPRYVQTQISCVLARGKCDRTGREIKEILPEFFQRGCAACSEDQKVKAGKITDHMKVNYPEEWVEIQHTYS